MNEFPIDVSACRGRQQRLTQWMQENNIDLSIIVLHEHLQWLTGQYFPRVFQPAAALTVEGHLTLVAPPKAQFEVPTVDELLTYEAQWLSTMRNDQRQASTDVLLNFLKSKPAPKKIGVEFSACGPQIIDALNTTKQDIEPTLYRMRRRKDADEMILMRKAIDGTEAMYRVARDIIKPGISEIEVFNQLQTTAVAEFGEMLTGTGNDYQCNARGGPPRNQVIAGAGELYILDLGPAFRGYFADNARTICVDGNPTDIQMQAWQHIQKVFTLILEKVKPGYSARKLYEEVKALMDECRLGQFDHHLGHGVGLFPHEAPHLNPNWDDHFEEGDFFTAEPGLYSDTLKHGMRLENNYLVTSTGVELLTPFDISL